MNNCDRCEGKGTIQVSNNGIIVVRPCPKCNELNTQRDQSLFLNQLDKVITEAEEPTVVKNLRIIGTYGEPDYLFTGTLLSAIESAWNYEADVYSIDDKGEPDDCLFTSWEDNEELCLMLKPYGLEILDGEKQREVRVIEQPKRMEEK
ncbi:hypothetical protein [Enterococcus rotai]|uniref:hypothetical protein n=1 Tax=Enterococcus rotai TaxID=118060 RepID=UPI0032B46072